MRLEWKYTLIINIFIIATMSVFFMINDRMVQKETVLSVTSDYIRGISMREVASDIQERITGEYDADKLTKTIRSLDLNKMGLEIVDINIMDTNGVVIASLTGKSLYEQLDNDGVRMAMSRQMRVRYPPEGYFGHWVIEYTLPYIISPPSARPEELGVLQIMFSARSIAIDSRRRRMEHLIYVAIATVVLTIFINPLTSYLIVRRLQRLMNTMAAAQAGDLAARAMDSSMDEIGRLSTSFNKMMEQISSEHASRLEALGNLAAGVAHEVRNPLNSISMTIQYLKDDREMKSDEAIECLEVMAKQVKELDRIVEEFIQLTRPVEMDLKIVDLNNFMDDILHDYASSFEIAKITLKCDYSKDPIYIKIDKDKIKQAFSNIIINAIQAMPQGGQLCVTTSWDKSQRIAIIEISDTGIGISEENIDRLFEPYFTTKPNGTGLGLAITYRVIESHGGDIRVKSIEGQGATFTVVLPQG